MVPIAIGLNINWVAIGDRFNLYHVMMYLGIMVFPLNAFALDTMINLLMEQCVQFNRLTNRCLINKYIFTGHTLSYGTNCLDSKSQLVPRKSVQ